VNEHLDFLLLGLGNGAIYAALAVAIVIVYRSSGVLNFATGAMALQAAQTYVFLRNGALLVLVPLLPTTVALGGPWGLWPALGLTVLLESLFGLGLYLVVFRPLRHRSELARTVASIGVMVLLGALVAQRAVDGPALGAAIFPEGRIQVAGSFITADRLYLALTVLLLAGSLAALDRFTRFGLHTRAASETEVGALVSGLSPDRIGAANWALSGATGKGIPHSVVNVANRNPATPPMASWASEICPR
jgi:branched-subunit amino acid ABC-type transport system permease component